LSIWLSATPGNAGNAGAEREGEGVDPGRAMPIDDAIGRFWVTARICRPKRVRFSTRAGGEDDQRRRR
jgi:hypothetical protein